MKKIGVNMDWFKSSRKKKTEDYEKEYLSRYKKDQMTEPQRKTSKPKKSTEAESYETNQKTKVMPQKLRK